MLNLFQHLSCSGRRRSWGEMDPETSSGWQSGRAKHFHVGKWRTQPQSHPRRRGL